MVPSALDSIRWKLSRAHMNLAYLQTLTREGWNGSEFYGIVRDVEEEPGYTIWRAKIPPMRGVQVAIVAGEIVYQLRSIFEHIAWAANPNPIPKITGFPVLTKDPKTDAHSQARFDQLTKGIPTQPLNFIDEYQPYKIIPDEQTHFVWVLEELWNIDKHRRLNFGVFATQGQVNPFTHPGVITFSWKIANTNALEDGDEIMRLTVDELTREHGIDDQLSLQVRFGPGPAKGAPVVETLRDFADAVENAINDFAQFLR